jgi:hypothetical protein
MKAHNFFSEEVIIFVSPAFTFICLWVNNFSQSFYLTAINICKERKNLNHQQNGENSDVYYSTMSR